MPNTEARIPTGRAARYLEQLCSHLSAMGRMRHLPAGGHSPAGMPRVESVEQTGDRAVIRFTDGAWIVQAHRDALVLRVEADDIAALERLTSAISARIAKIGRRDGLTATWSSPAGGHSPAAGSGGRRPRRNGVAARWRRLGWFLLAAVAVAIHLGLVGSLLGAGRWGNLAADTVTVLIAGKLILLAVHARLGRNRAHRATPPHDPGVEPETHG